MQAAGLTEHLAEKGPLPILSSPLQRAQQTAAPLAERWGVEAVVERRVGEIPSPTADLAERSAWLRSALRSRWTDLGPAVAAWRSQLLSALYALRTDTVVFSHFVAINAIVASASDDAALIVFAPANASCTIVDIEGGRVSVVELGRQAGSAVS